MKIREVIPYVPFLAASLVAGSGIIHNPEYNLILANAANGGIISLLAYDILSPSKRGSEVKTLEDIE